MSEPAAGPELSSGRSGPPAAVQMAIAFAIGLVGVGVFRLLRLPLPWFLGSMTAVLIASTLNAPVMRADFLSKPMRAVLGFAVGSSFTPALISQAGGMAASLLMMIPFTIAIIYLGTRFLQRVAGFDERTAFFAAVPGGLTDMTLLSADAGADPRRVMLTHATRIIVIVFTLPFIIQYGFGLPISGGQVSRVRLADFTWEDAFTIVLIAGAGWWLFARFELFGAQLIGPMFLSALAHITGLTTTAIPSELLNVVQWILGVLLGCQFRGTTARDFATTVTWAVLWAIVLVIGSMGVAYAVHRTTGLALVPALLAYCPGGQSELMLVAFVLGLDVPFIALHHLLRLVIVILGAQFVYKRRPDWHLPRKTPSEGGNAQS